MAEIGTGCANDGQYFLHVFFGKHCGNHGLFSREHTVYVAANGIDFSVMEDKAVGVGPLPAGIGIG